MNKLPPNSTSKAAERDTELGRFQPVIDAYRAFPGADALPPEHLDLKILALADANGAKDTISPVPKTRSVRQRRWPFALAASVATIGFAALLARHTLREVPSYESASSPAVVTTKTAAAEISKPSAAPAPAPAAAPNDGANALAKESAPEASVASTGAGNGLTGELSTEQMPSELSDLAATSEPETARQDPSPETSKPKRDVNGLATEDESPPAMTSEVAPMAAPVLIAEPDSGLVVADKSEDARRSESKANEVQASEQRRDADAANAPMKALADQAPQSDAAPAPSSEATSLGLSTPEPLVSSTDDTETLDSVEVTGTRIRRADAETAQPMLQVAPESVAAAGVSEEFDRAASSPASRAGAAPTNPPDPHEALFAKVRELRQAGQIDAAREMLARLVKAYPSAEIPKDLQELTTKKPHRQEP